MASLRLWAFTVSAATAVLFGVFWLVRRKQSSNKNSAIKSQQKSIKSGDNDQTKKGIGAEPNSRHAEPESWSSVNAEQPDTESIQKLVANTNANAHSSIRAAREVVEHGQGQVGSSLSSASDERQPSFEDAKHSLAGHETETDAFGKVDQTEVKTFINGEATEKPALLYQRCPITPGTGAVPKSVFTGQQGTSKTDGSEKSLDTQLSVLSVDGGEQDDNRIRQPSCEDSKHPLAGQGTKTRDDFGKADQTEVKTFIPRVATEQPAVLYERTPITPGTGAVPKSVFTGQHGTSKTDGSEKTLDTQFSVLSLDGGEQDDNQMLDQLWQQQYRRPVDDNPLPSYKIQFQEQQQQNLTLVGDNPLPSQFEEQQQQSLTQVDNPFPSHQPQFQGQTPKGVHPSDSSPAICQGGSGAVNIFGGNNTFESLIINGKKTVSTPNLSSDSALPPAEDCFEGDGVIFHSEADYDAAVQFKSDLEEDIPNIKVDLFSFIDPNLTLNKSLETILERYRYVFILITKSLKSDEATRQVGENLQADTWDSNYKKNRIVPVWMSSNKEHCPIEFKSIKGLLYYKRSDEDFRNLYQEGLRKQVAFARQNSIEWTKQIKRDLQLAKDSHGGEADCKELVNP